MKKKLITLAVAGALATPMAVFAVGSNVTLFGTVQAEYSTVDIDGQTSEAEIGDPTGKSRFGVQITEQLGAGLKAKAHIEYGLSTGSDSIGIARERWVALANNSWGEVKFGRVQSPFKDFAGGMTIDAFAYTSLQAGGSGGTMYSPDNGYGVAANGFVNNAARYDSPVVDGFAFSALLMPSDSHRLDPTMLPAIGGSPANAGGEDGEWDFQVAAKKNIQHGPHSFDVFGGYSRDNVSDNQKAFIPGNVDDEEVWRAGASWTYENLRLSGQYENVNNAVGAATCTAAASMGTLGADSRAQCNSAMNLNGDGDILFLGANYDMGNTTLIAQGGATYAKKVSGFAPSHDAKSFTVGAIHHLSRRSSLFGGYQRVALSGGTAVVGQPNVNRDRNTYTVGMRHDF